MQFAPMVSTFPIRGFGFTCPGFGTGNPASANRNPQRRRAPLLIQALNRGHCLRLLPRTRFQIFASSGRKSSPTDSLMIRSPFKAACLVWTRKGPTDGVLSRICHGRGDWSSIENFGPVANWEVV
jgi:hypothetical protein